MTAIAANRRMMAADTQADHGGRRHCAMKLFRVNHHIIGTAGEYSKAISFVEWFKDKKGKPPKGDYECLVLSPEGVLSLWAGGDRTPIPDEFYSIGTGAEACLAAMHCQRSPKEAVRIAKKVCVDVGGRTNVMRI